MAKNCVEWGYSSRVVSPPCMYGFAHAEISVGFFLLKMGQTAIQSKDSDVKRSVKTRRVWPIAWRGRENTRGWGASKMQSEMQTEWAVINGPDDPILRQ